LLRTTLAVLLELELPHQELSAGASLGERRELAPDHRQRELHA
jgi:hypothetical protein